MKNIIRLLFSFRGAIGRLKFLYGHLIQCALVILPWIIFITPKFEQQQMQGNLTFLGLFTAFFILLGVIFLIWTGLALTVKRLRDLDMSLWWLIMGFIPTINIIFLLILQFTPGVNFEVREKPENATFN